jgi:Tetratricopeptide repeat
MESRNSELKALHVELNESLNSEEQHLSSERDTLSGAFKSALRKLSAIALVLAAVTTVTIVATDGRVQGNEKIIPEYRNIRTGVEYVGDEACRQCHSAKYETFKKTGMGRSMSRAALAPNASSNPVTLDMKDGRVYSVFFKDGKMLHSETQLDASRKPIFTETHQVAYSVGSGEHGRSYLIERDNFLFLSPVSFYTRVGKWGLSPGNDSGLFRGFTRPAGNLCVFCHSGLSRPVPGATNEYEQPNFQILAIGCERCHGPGSLHVAEQRSANPVENSVSRSIVNPRNLAPRLRDDVCYQCHLSGDARVLQPGKSINDFRPGTNLNDTVAIFLVPSKMKVGGFQALSQPEQMQMSRCRQRDGSVLNCITCHDPHVQKFGFESAKDFDGKCIGCHSPGSPRFVASHREKGQQGSCTTCHMPKVEVTNIAHLALTDHRIARNPRAVDNSLTGTQPDPLTNLIWTTKPSDERNPGLRTLALAFAQLAPKYPGYGERGFRVLERAAREFPNDADVQATYAEVLLAISPDFKGRAKEALERAIKLGSRSTTVRRRFAQLMLADGNQEGIGLLQQAVQMEPYNAAIYLQLAHAHLDVNKRAEAVKTLEQALLVDPGNPECRKLLRELQSGR